jgi:high-affinity nickel-transport protein
MLVFLFSAGSKYPGLISPGILAFSFGLRHAVDADHIAAIDNVTRKLIQEGKKPLTVGLWFSLGHSSVVVILCIAIAAGSSYLREHLSDAQSIGLIVGTAVSAAMLLLIGGVNLWITVKLAKTWRKSRRAAKDPTAAALGNSQGLGEEHAHEDGIPHSHMVNIDADAKVEGPGFLTKCCPTVFKAVDSPWKMYPIGFLFGLGFDTASEVALLALASMAPKKGIPAGYVMVLPLMFGVGMCLIDTLDGMMMLWAYVHIYHSHSFKVVIEPF